MWYQIEAIAAGPEATEIGGKLPIEILMPELEIFLTSRGWKVDHMQSYLIPFYDSPVVLEKDE